MSVVPDRDEPRSWEYVVREYQALVTSGVAVPPAREYVARYPLWAEQLRAFFGPAAAGGDTAGGLSTGPTPVRRPTHRPVLFIPDERRRRVEALLATRLARLGSTLILPTSSPPFAAPENVSGRRISQQFDCSSIKAGRGGK